MSIKPNVAAMSAKKQETTRLALQGILRDDVFLGLELSEKQRELFVLALNSLNNGEVS